MTIEIVTSNAEISRRVMVAIAKKVKELSFEMKLQKLKQDIANFLYNKFITSEVYASLAGGILRAEFGYASPDGKATVSARHRFYPPSNYSCS